MAEEKRSEDAFKGRKVVTTPNIKVDKLRQIYIETGVGFPADADESRRQGGTTVEIDESEADEKIGA